MRHRSIRSSRSCLPPTAPSPRPKLCSAPGSSSTADSAQIVRVRLHDDSKNTETIEAVALIEGDEGLVYSIALRCAPQDFTRLEPVFQKVIHSWRIQPPATHSANPSQPKQDSNKK